MELKTYIAVPDPYWAERAFLGSNAGLGYAVSTRDRSRRDPGKRCKRFGRSNESGGTAAPAASQNREEPGMGERSTRRDRDRPHRPTLSGPEWVAEYQCAKGHVFTEYTKKSSLASRAPVVTGLGGGYWGKGLRASLRRAVSPL